MATVSLLTQSLARVAPVGAVPAALGTLVLGVPFPTCLPTALPDAPPHHWILKGGKM